MDLVQRFRERPVPKARAFSASEYQARLARVRDAMARHDIDLLVVHSLPNICYLTGYETPMSDWYACLLVPAEGPLTLHACDVGLALAHTYLDNIEWVRWDTMGQGAGQLVEAIRRHRIERHRLGLEMRRPGLNAYTYEQLRRQFGQADLVDATDVVLGVRTVKSAAEIECLRRAGGYTEQGMQAAITAARPGATENTIAAAACEAMIRAGSEFFSIDPHIRTGVRASMAHATYRRNEVKRGDAIILEMGGVHQRYTAPLYRTVVVGPPSERVKRLAAVCLEALERLYETIRPGRTFDDAAQAADKILAQADDEAEIVPSHGYSVGLGFPPDWVEHSVFIRAGSTEVFQEGMVFHTPRSLRVPGETSAGFSETIVVTPHGCERISSLPRQLITV